MFCSLISIFLLSFILDKILYISFMVGMRTELTCGSEMLVNVSQGFKSPFMCSAWGVTWNVVNHLPCLRAAILPSTFEWKKKLFPKIYITSLDVGYFVQAIYNVNSNAWPLCVYEARNWSPNGATPSAGTVLIIKFESSVQNKSWKIIGPVRYVICQPNNQNMLQMNSGKVISPRHFAGNSFKLILSEECHIQFTFTEIYLQGSILLYVSIGSDNGLTQISANLLSEAMMT